MFGCVLSGVHSVRDRHSKESNMRLRHCLGALLLSASAPAAADMYLFDAHAWTAGSQPASATREEAASAPLDNWPTLVTTTIFADPVRAIRITRDSLRHAMHETVRRRWSL